MAEFKFFCPQCGRQIQCGTSYSGTQINCPVCEQAIVVPQVPRAASPAIPQPVAAKSRSLRNILPIVAAVLVLAGLVIGGWYGYSKLKIHKSPPGLVALWSGEGNGNDSVGGNKMELTDISFAEGKMGQAFSFNGVSSSIRIPASQSLDVGAGDGFTIMAWIKPADVNGYHPLFAWSDGVPLNSAIDFNSTQSGALMVCVTDGEGNRFLVSNQRVLASSVWQHIALTYDKASGIGTWYLNGVVVAQRHLSGQVNSTKGDLVISHRDTAQGNWSSNRSFAGLMDELAIYNRALSGPEIQAICAEQNHGEPLTSPAPSAGWYESWMR